MKRRDFIKFLAASGVSAAVSPWLMASAAAADQPQYSGPLLIFVQASGGWDPTQFCDPKPELARGFGHDEIETVGNLRYAPMGWTDATGNFYPYAHDFFSRFHESCVIVQGINMQTGSHRPGKINAFQGSFDIGFPTLAAAVCAAHAPNLLMGLLVTGGHVSTGGLVPYTSISSPDLVRSLAVPNAASGIPNGLDGKRMPDEIFEMINTERRRITETLLNRKSLTPRKREALEFFSSSTATAGLERLGDIIGSDGFQTYDEQMRSNRLVAHADVTLHSMAAGLTAAADMQLYSYFDSHADHFKLQGRSYTDLVYALRFLWDRAEQIDARTGSNISDRLTVVIHSEFGRTPHFNSDGGTDHWPTTSAIVMRKDFASNGVGGRVVGCSTNDGQYRPGRINPATLQPDEHGGLQITSAHFHKALRSHLGVSGLPTLSRFDFSEVEDIAMFSPGLSTPQV